MIRVVIFLCVVSLLGVSQGASLKRIIYPKEVNQYATLYPYYCRAVCMIYCPYGNVLNKYGCPICKCKDPPVKSNNPSKNWF